MIVSDKIHSVFSLLFLLGDLTMQASVVCVICYEFTFSSCAMQYNIDQCFIMYFVLYFVLSDVALEWP